ncbi:hypothetical protein P692DRAFT_201787466, partial [Suillus brevipes Sb2]
MKFAWVRKLIISARFVLLYITTSQPLKHTSPASGNYFTIHTSQKHGSRHPQALRRAHLRNHNDISTIQDHYEFPYPSQISNTNSTPKP